MNDLDNNIASMEGEDRRVINYLPVNVMPAVSEFYQKNCNCPLIYCEEYVCSVYKNSIWYRN
jgi:hypothetical protein